MCLQPWNIFQNSIICWVNSLIGRLLAKWVPEASFLIPEPEAHCSLLTPTHKEALKTETELTKDQAVSLTFELEMASHFAKVSHIAVMLSLSLRTVHRRIEENGLFAEKESWTKHTAKQWANALSSKQWDMLGETKCVLLCLNLKIDLTGLVFRVKSWKTDSQKWFNSQRNTRW